MELYTLGRDFLKRDVIDGFHSLIWTEKYYGDSEVELVIPSTPDMRQKISDGTFLTIDDSSEVMILETAEDQDGKLKMTGISLLKWLNNRFVRTSANHEDKYWYIEGTTPGWVLWEIVNKMCCAGSPYLDGSINIGITNPQRFIIPGLGLGDYDRSGPALSVGVPYGPVYDALREIATTFSLGMQITLESADENSYSLAFWSYMGLDRTSEQNVNPPVRFSPHMDSFANIKELRSMANLKTLVFAWAPSNPDGLATVPGESSLTGEQYTGFDLRAKQIFAEDITTDMVGASSENLVDVLNSRALDELTNSSFVQAVDGEIVPDNQFQYGKHYNLGDLVEVEGNSGAVKVARVTEYIRSKDNSGEKAYPTVTVIDQ